VLIFVKSDALPLAKQNISFSSFGSFSIIYLSALICPCTYAPKKTELLEGYENKLLIFELPDLA
jgi:hypothetical protein